MADEPNAPYGDLPYVMSGLPRRRNPYDARRQMAMGMVQGGMDFSPVAHPLQGASRLAQALVGSLMMRSADSEEAAAEKARQDAIGQAASIADPQERLAAFAKLDPSIGLKAGAQSAMQEIASKRAAEQSQQAAVAFGNSYGMGGGIGDPASAIASIESGGRYDAMGPETGQGRAHGKYQVMPSNIGPWTREVLGQELTPAQFLASPQAQDAVFQAKFGQYTQKYGPEGAARAWFAGEGGMNDMGRRDVLGTSVADYSRKFQAAGGGRQLAQGDAVQGNGSGNAMPPILPPGQAEIGKPDADPEVVRRAIGLTQIPKSAGGITMGEAQRMIEQDRMERWKLLQGDANEQRKIQAQIAQEDRKRQGEIDRVAPEAFIKGATENYSKNVRPKAENAVADISGIHQIRQLLDAGAFTGTAADAKTYLAKLGELVGMSPSETAANTQVLQAQLANRVLAGMGGSLGAGFSNADRDFVEKAKGGQIAMTETALRRLMDIGERQAKLTLDAHAREVDRFSKVPELARMTGGQFFELPPVQSYQEWSKANPLPSANPQQGGQPQGQQLPTIGSPAEAAKLPKGTRFRDPDGNIRVVP